MRTERPPREAYSALAVLPGHQYAQMDFAMSFWGLTAGCPLVLKVEDEGGQRRYRCLVCWKQGFSDVLQGLIAEPSHVMSKRHMERLKMWPRISGMIRESEPGPDMEDRIALANEWIFKYGPGPYELDHRPDASLTVLGWSSVIDFAGGVY